MTKISVIVPVYNQENYITDCLDSLACQSFGNYDFEVICIDDGSTDASFAKIIDSSYKHPHLNLKYKQKRNGGLSSARNEGLEYASGELVMFLDSDDTINPKTLELVWNKYLETGSDIIVFGMHAYSEGNVSQDLTMMNDYLRLPIIGTPELSFDTMIKTNIHVCNKAFSKDLLDFRHDKPIRFIEGLLYEDIYFMWKAFLSADSASYIDYTGYNYRVHSGSIMENTAKDKTYERAIHHLRNWYELFRTFKQHKHAFLANYEALSYLLDKYDRNTKRTCLEKDYDKVNVVYNLYKEEFEGTYRRHSNAD